MERRSDLFRVPRSAFEGAAEKLYQLFNHRYNSRLPTVVTTNRNLAALEGRLASRLSDQRLCRHVRLNAADYRRR